jgi:hypothetical protein
MISSDDCKTRAVECYQAAQNATDYDARQALLGLAVQWCELASRMDSMSQKFPLVGDSLWRAFPE